MRRELHLRKLPGALKIKETNPLARLVRTIRPKGCSISSNLAVQVTGYLLDEHTRHSKEKGGTASRTVVFRCWK